MKGLGLITLAVILAASVSGYADTIPSTADFLGYGTLKVTASGPYDNYALDYDGEITANISGIAFPTSLVDVFCVSIENLDNRFTDYDFYKFDTPATSEDKKFARATWIADNWIGLIGYSDENKGEAQKAIWQILNVLILVDSTGKDRYLYDLAVNDATVSKEFYVTENWLLAVNPSTHDGNNNNDYYNSQNFLVPFNSREEVPAPEPSTLILLGLGLAGIGAYRKFRS